MIIGSRNAVSYKDIFQYIKNNQIWLGAGFKQGNAYFKVLDTDTKRFASGVYDDKTGLVKFRNVTWFTNLELKKRSEILETIYTYEKYPDKYPKYDNYDAINVDKTNEIPLDYKGIMGVPITFLDKHNPKQFEIVGLGTGNIAKDLGVKKNYRGRTDLSLGNLTCPYNRILIRQIATVEKLKKQIEKE